MPPHEVISDAALPWLIRFAGLFWLAGAIALFRQIQREMTLERMRSRIIAMSRDLQDEESAEAAAAERRKKDPEEKIAEAWMDRDAASRRGWLAGQAVVLAITAILMLVMHSMATYMVALLVLGQGIYFFWREYARWEAPSLETAAHARPTEANVNAAWVTLAIAILVWLAEYRDLLDWHWVS